MQARRRGARVLTSFLELVERSRAAERLRRPDETTECTYLYIYSGKVGWVTRSMYAFRSSNGKSSVLTPLRNRRMPNEGVAILFGDGHVTLTCPLLPGMSERMKHLCWPIECSPGDQFSVVPHPCTPARRVPVG